MSSETTIAIVDDDAAVREGLEALLTAKGYLVELYASAEAFLAALQQTQCACLVADVRMPGMSGLELQAELRRRSVALPVIVVTGHGDVPMAVAAVKAGAADFLEKPFEADALISSIAEALRPTAAPADLAAARTRIAELTPREREVMDLVTVGLSNKVIAHRLGIAVRTVEIHRARVMEKTGAQSLPELVRLAVGLEAGPG